MEQSCKLTVRLRRVWNTLEKPSALSAGVLDRCWAPEKGLGRHESASLAEKSRREERLLCWGPLGLCWAGSKEWRKGPRRKGGAR